MFALTTLPHLVFASELLKAMTLLPSAQIVETTSSGWGVIEWTAIVMACSAVVAALATVALFCVALTARNEWESNTKKQAHYDIAKLMAAQLPDLSWRVVCAASELRLLCGSVQFLNELSQDELGKYDKQSEILKVCYFLLFNLEQRIFPLLNAAGIKPESHKAFMQMTQLITVMHPNGQVCDRTFIHNSEHAFEIASQIHEKAKVIWNDFNYADYRQLS